MNGKWGISTGFGVIALICTFLFSLMNNTWQTSLFRAGIGFILFFILGFITLVSLKQISQRKITLQTSGKVEDKNQLTIDQESETEAEMDEMDFQAIPLQALHNGETSKHSD
jgi:hypothetical protein